MSNDYIRNRVELTLVIGQFGERREVIAVPISAELARDLTEPVELSDEPFSLMLASPGFFGGYGNAIEIRQKKFSLRRKIAHDLATTIEQKLIELFGINDEQDGYKKRGLR